MRALLFCLDFPPAVGGIQTMLGSLTAELGSWDLTVVAPREFGDRESDRNRACTMVRAPGLGHGPRGRRFMAGVALHSLRAALRRRPQVLLCGHPTLTPVALLLHRLLRIPYFIFSYDVEMRQPRLRRWLQPVFSSTAGVLTISEYNRQIVAALGCPASRLLHLPLGHDPRRFAGVPPSGIVEKLGLTGHPWLLTVCRLDDPYKGVDRMLQALPAIQRAVPHVRYVVAGDGKLRGELETQARGMDGGDRVHFTGRVSEADLAALYAGCSAFALMSRDSPTEGGAEGFGLVFLEASSFGKALLGGHSGGIPDAVLDERTGLLADPNDPAAIARQAARLLTDPHLAERLGQNGRRRVEQELTWAAAAQKLRAHVESRI